MSATGGGSRPPWSGSPPPGSCSPGCSGAVSWPWPTGPSPSGSWRPCGARREGPGGDPDLQRGRVGDDRPGPGAGRRPPGRRAGGRRRQPRRHGQAGPGAGRRRAPRPPDGAVGQAGAGRRLPGRVRLGAGARLRRPGRDGRRPLPPPGAAAGPARRARRRRPGHRVPVCPRGAHGQLEPAPGGDLARRQRLCPPGPAGAGARLHGRLPRLPAGGAGGAAGFLGPVQWLLLPGRDGPQVLAGGVPGGRGADHLHRAGLGGVQDEQADRRRGPAAGHPVGPDRRPPPGPGPPPPQRRPGGRLTWPMPLDPGAEAAAVTTALRALAPELTVVPIIRTERPFYGARVGDLRAVAAGWRRGHPRATPAEVAALADRLWRAGIREQQLVACFLLAGDPAALAATDPERVREWAALLDNWETTDQLGMNVLGPLVALDPGRRFGLLEAMAGDSHPFTRRLALVACTRLARADGAAALWQRVAGLLLALAGDRAA